MHDIGIRLKIELSTGIIYQEALRLPFVYLTGHFKVDLLEWQHSFGPHKTHLKYINSLVVDF